MLLTNVASRASSNVRMLNGAQIGKFVGLCAAISIFLLFLLVIGAAVPILPIWFVGGAVLAPVFLIASIRWRLLAFAIILALIFEVIPGRFVPGVGRFRIYELLLIFMAGMVFFMRILEKRPIFSPIGKYILPISALFFCLLVSAIYVRFYAPNPNLLTELRTFVAWLALPIACWLISDEKQREAIVHILIGFGLVISLFVTAQSFFEITILSNRVEVLDQQNRDVTRSIAGGATYLMVFVLVWSTMNVLQLRRIPISILFSFISLVGLAVSFGRGIWLATLVGTLVAAYITRGTRGVIASGLSIVLASAVLLSGLYVIKPRVVEALADRAFSVVGEVERGGSFGWRKQENNLALRKLEDNPLTGVGLGGEYKSTISGQGSFLNETRYIHNAYIGLMVKMGVQAILFPVLMVLVFISYFRAARSAANDRDLPAIAAVFAMFLVPCITSYTQPEWLTAQGICVLSIASVLMMRYSPASRTRSRI